MSNSEIVNKQKIDIEIKNAAQQIGATDAHSYLKHADKFNDKTYGSVSDDITVKSRQDFQNVIQNALHDPRTEGFMDKSGRSFLYNEKYNIAVVLDPYTKDGGTAFRPDDAKGWIKDRLNTAHIADPTIKIQPGGYAAIHYPESVIGKQAAYLSTLGHELSGFGKGLKIVGKGAGHALVALGVGLAGYEAFGLNNSAEAAEQQGLISKDALLEYRGIIATHVAQSTADPSIVGGETAVQGAYELWAKKNNIPEILKKELEPSSLIEMVTGKQILKMTEPSKEEVYNALPDMDDPAIANNPEMQMLCECKNHINAIDQKLLKTKNPDEMNKLMDQQAAASSIFDERYAELKTHGGIQHVYEHIEQNACTFEQPAPAIDQSPKPGQPQQPSVHRPSSLSL